MSETVYAFTRWRHVTKLLPLTSQTKLTLTLSPKNQLTLEHGTNPSKP